MNLILYFKFDRLENIVSWHVITEIKDEQQQKKMGMM